MFSSESKGKVGFVRIQFGCYFIRISVQYLKGVNIYIHEGSSAASHPPSKSSGLRLYSVWTSMTSNSFRPTVLTGSVIWISDVVSDGLDEQHDHDAREQRQHSHGSGELWRVIEHDPQPAMIHFHFLFELEPQGV